jgi:hypothetical protein
MPTMSISRALISELVRRFIRCTWELWVGFRRCHGFCRYNW